MRSSETRERAPAAEPSASEGILDDLPPGVGEAASRLLARIPRLDRSVDLAPAAGSLLWTFEGRPLFALARRGAGLEGEIAPGSRSFPIRSAREAEAFLDEVLREIAARLADADAPAPGREPLLTPEEIAAFRDG